MKRCFGRYLPAWSLLFFFYIPFFSSSFWGGGAHTCFIFASYLLHCRICVVLLPLWSLFFFPRFAAAFLLFNSLPPWAFIFVFFFCFSPYINTR
ncbi:hypothetical protein BD289DRAFT_448615 [Coniella lustricola]|uniref:Uncharacterized protein n=1 Tax=Coniella lustricola TaxID=2025994 RepID=A0A2T2ZS19_9PEZI|nr:hypothetical protein BD289DRAFT_448615 [Coniella lustricola]